MEFLSCTATVPTGSGLCNSHNALSYCPGGVCSGTGAMHCLTAKGLCGVESAIQWLIACRQWAVELLQCTASLIGDSGR